MKVKKSLIRILLLAVLVLAALIIIRGCLGRQPYWFKNDRFYYSAERGVPDYKMRLVNSSGNVDVFAVDFESRSFLDYSTRIYGLLFMPRNREKIPGLILLPGGSVTKEGESRTAEGIAEWGYAVLVIDQRGIGETGGYYPGIKDDYQIFLQGREPVQHLSVYDALKAYDVLRELKNIDRDNIAVAGESMGGKYAVIAAAIEKRLKGVLVISSSGYHFKMQGTNANSYLLSIDPDSYISGISPRPVFMLHGTNDPVVSLDDARITFSLAGELKGFFTAEGCGHGYCKIMEPELKKELAIILGK